MKESTRVVPLLVVSEGGRVHEIQTFAHYVANQIGFEDLNQCPHLHSLAYDYLKKNEGYEQNLLAFFHNKMNPDALLVKLIEELDKCILGYFSFHWKCATQVITQVLTSEHPRRKLRRMVMEATRKIRFERVTRELKVTRLFSTLMEELKAIGVSCHDHRPGSTEVMVPAAHSDRSPVLLLMGGGMGAGKSTVLKQIMKEVFWSGAAANAVVVEADAFKESDVIYQAINSRGHHNDMLQTAELVHQWSTDAAASLLVTALNEGRDVIMDGTLSWEPFVLQTIAMARSVHRQRYRMGAGYKVAADGSTIVEKYWEPVEEAESTGSSSSSRAGYKPYRIELVGIICDACLAVVRGIRRAIISGRAVRVNSQLKSHKRFAGAFRKYCELVDNARLYSTNTIAGAKLIGWKDKDSRLLVDVDEIGLLDRVSRINEEANCVHELYPEGGHPTDGAESVWEDLVASPLRASIQRELKEAILDSEACFPSP
ncbi:hypothetical protein PR202_ga09476 [Eleusine coracana subsp. coracana]|uniref:Zeta toxin domain-containing protein n=1 Tax=Eleusine coracana subsp. coracana TaxID=191504 RepID=A0AAV5C511_ELECO|nr:hypothetical protein QOZ80_1AG0035300 [Eleusine coracana subsp. coracana]GJM92967.1 hypothetical protein PR202_ga09476 [Eleusine coracana subsp. coracana]